jgi:hypothetical protein
MVRMLVGKPNVRDSAQVLRPKHGLRIECPAVIERLTLQPGIVRYALDIETLDRYL